MMRGLSLFVALCTVIPNVLTAALPAPESSALLSRSDHQVRSISVPYNDTEGYTETIELNFDGPVDQSIIDDYTAKLSRREEPALVRRLGPQYLSCEGSGDWSDSNGKLSLQLTCSTRSYLAWGFRISTAVKAIIVSPVSERGLAWFRNGITMPMNAPHVVDKGYIFHGTMTGPKGEAVVEYNDYYTFRHNVGPGGTGSIYWQGKVHLLNN